MPELSVVMPVYNEVDAIGDAVREWTEALDGLGIDYLLTVYDDGSRDGTPDVLQTLLRSHPRLRVERHENRGHGPTIMRGYHEATGEWVFQVDSDRELRAADFAQLWHTRHQYDLLMGRRVHRVSPPSRRLITWLARVVVRALFGGHVRDVNIPYRLVRRAALERMLVRIPATGSVPNVIMSGLAARDGLRVIEYPIRHHQRRAGVSMSPGRALRLGWHCFREAVAIRRGRVSSR